MDINVSIVIPVFNGETTIGRLTEKLIETLGEEKLQIVLVNDGSSDNSHTECLAIYSKRPRVIKYINLSRNFGEHSAVIAGLNYADGDYVVIMDDDFQNPPEEVSKLINKAATGNYDIVYACYKEKKHSLFRNLGSKFNDYIATILLSKPKGLYLSSFKCLSRFAVKEIIKYKGPFTYIDGLALRITRNIGVEEVRHSPRQAGSSGYTLRKLIRLWLNMFVNFSIMPLRLSLALGVIMSIAGFIFSVVVINEKISNPEIAIGWSSLIITVLIFSGAQLLSLGLIGEYLGRLFLTINNTPQFTIRNIHKDHEDHERQP